MCVYANKGDLLSALSSHNDHFLRTLIDEKLQSINVPIKDLRRQVSFDTEECCRRETAATGKSVSVDQSHKQRSKLNYLGGYGLRPSVA